MLMLKARNEDAARERGQRRAGGRGARLLGVGLLGALLSVTPARAAAPAPAAHSESSPLPFPPGLKTQIKFWKDIFATYSTREVVIHDSLHLGRIYDVLDFRPLAESGLSDAEIAAYAQEKVEREKERVRATLLRLHQLGPHPPGLTEEERKIWALFGNVKTPSKFLAAAAKDRLRAQTGLRDRFAAGVEVSRRYLPEMEAIFRREGLPVELTRLPLVESCFNVRAYSKAGAAGIWQFMPVTGRLYMRIDDAVDERRDPIASTEAAAQHLKTNYEVLGTWPLAITAYNHGRAGMVRAVAQVGTTDLVQIIKRYNGSSFKFASRNFYAEFLAALEVERHFTDYFGELHAHPPLRADMVVVPDYVGLQSLARAAGTASNTLADLNPALSREVVAGKLYVPKGHRLRVPAGAAAAFTTRYASLPANQKYARQRALYVTHRVRRGQTLTGIAKRYGTTVAAIQRRNNLRNGHVRAGQSLLIPSG
jgi:membrane-bound lytic murein transglycosylase D